MKKEQNKLKIFKAWLYKRCLRVIDTQYNHTSNDKVYKEGGIRYNELIRLFNVFDSIDNGKVIHYLKVERSQYKHCSQKIESLLCNYKGSLEKSLYTIDKNKVTCLKCLNKM